MSLKNRNSDTGSRIYGSLRRRSVFLRIGKFVGRKWLIALFGFLVFLDAFAQTSDTVIVVPTRYGGAYQEFIRAFEVSLNENKGIKAVGIRIVEASSVNDYKFDETYSKIRLIVTVGTAAAKAVHDLKPSVPVLNTLIPRNSYRAMSADRNNSRLSSIYLDQPLERHFGLIESVLPGNRNVSVVLGPNTGYLRSELRSLAGKHGILIKIEKMSPGQRLAAPLSRALEDSDAFLAVADPVVSNRHTVQNLLLATYRQRVPVIAYSRAYVKAGALAAVYSTPLQIGKQAGEMVGELARSGNWSLPSPQYPKYYSVDINHQVAQSFGIRVPSTEVLERRLRQEREVPR